MNGDTKDYLSPRRDARLVLVLDTPKGRGVFAAQDIPAWTTIEVCPVLPLGVEENEQHIKHTSLHHYTYNWPVFTSDGNKKMTQAIIFGLGSMFNHARDQNVGWKRDLERQVIKYQTLRNVKAGEELCISYGDRLTFKDADAPVAVDEGDGSELLDKIQIDI